MVLAEGALVELLCAITCVVDRFPLSVRMLRCTGDEVYSFSCSFLSSKATFTIRSKCKVLDPEIVISHDGWLSSANALIRHSHGKFLAFMLGEARLNQSFLTCCVLATATRLLVNFTILPLLLFARCPLGIGSPPAPCQELVGVENNRSEGDRSFTSVANISHILGRSDLRNPSSECPTLLTSQPCKPTAV